MTLFIGENQSVDIAVFRPEFGYVRIKICPDDIKVMLEVGAGKEPLLCFDKSNRDLHTVVKKWLAQKLAEEKLTEE